METRIEQQCGVMQNHFRRNIELEEHKLLLSAAGWRILQSVREKSDLNRFREERDKSCRLSLVVSGLLGLKEIRLCGTNLKLLKLVMHESHYQSKKENGRNKLAMVREKSWKKISEQKYYTMKHSAVKINACMRAV